MSSAKQTKSWHLFNIFTELEKGNKVNMNAYSAQYNIDIRTVQRYLSEKKSELKSFFGDRLVHADGSYWLVNDKLMENLLLAPTNANELERIIDLYYMINPSVFDKLDPESAAIVQKYYKTSKACYHIKHSPFEELKNDKVMTELKKAIKGSRYCDCTYNPGYEKFELTNVKLIKIVFFDGNWYVACVDDSFEENNGFRWLRFGFIEEIRLKSGTFKRDMEAQNHINTFQNMFTRYRQNGYEVQVKINPSKTRYFLHKKHLRSQRLVKIDDKGYGIFSFTINNEMEILPMLHEWSPHMEVLSPVYIRKKYYEELSAAMELNKI